MLGKYHNWVSREPGDQYHCQKLSSSWYLVWKHCIRVAWKVVKQLKTEDVTKFADVRKNSKLGLTAVSLTEINFRNGDFCAYSV